VKCDKSRVYGDNVWFEWLSVESWCIELLFRDGRSMILGWLEESPLSCKCTWWLGGDVVRSSVLVEVLEVTEKRRSDRRIYIAEFAAAVDDEGSSYVV